MIQPEFAPITLLEHSGDLKFQACGHDLLEALANASEGMIAQIVPLALIEEREERTLTVEADDDEARIAAFLNEMLFLIYARKWLPRRVRTLSQCKRKGCQQLEAILVGELFDPARHPIQREIKAVTYHELSLTAESGITTIQFVCDL
jgi:SHS2 domain-containing protein